MRKINKIIVHCADTPDDKDFHVSDIDRWHKEFGWDGCGYHKVICRDGTIETGRDDSIEGIHAYGDNKTSIGICLIGRKSFTDAQFNSLRDLIDEYIGKYPDIENNIFGHCDCKNANGKTCPNFKVGKWYNQNKIEYTV